MISVTPCICLRIAWSRNRRNTCSYFRWFHAADDCSKKCEDCGTRKNNGGKGHYLPKVCIAWVHHIHGKRNKSKRNNTTDNQAAGNTDHRRSEYLRTHDPLDLSFCRAYRFKLSIELCISWNWDIQNVINQQIAADNDKDDNSSQWKNNGGGIALSNRYNFKGLTFCKRNLPF